MWGNIWGFFIVPSLCAGTILSVYFLTDHTYHRTVRMSAIGDCNCVHKSGTSRVQCRCRVEDYNVTIEHLVIAGDPVAMACHAEFTPLEMPDTYYRASAAPHPVIDIGPCEM